MSLPIVAADGTVRASLLIVRRDTLGERNLIATSAPLDGGSAAFAPVDARMLVVARHASPPDFLSRG
jgi:hypothetical protein